jgi:N-formylglutamate amidohydrolase
MIDIDSQGNLTVLFPNQWHPGNGVQAMQLELAQRAYLDEATNDYDDAKASQLADTLRALLAAFTMRA